MLSRTFIACFLSTALLLIAGCRGPQEKYPPEFTDERKQAAYNEGRAQAQADIERDHLELRFAGYPAPWVNGYADLLRERLGVHRKLTGCIVSPESTTRDDAYNAVMTAEIERRHGYGILDTLRGEAKARWQAARTRPAI